MSQIAQGVSNFPFKLSKHIDSIQEQHKHDQYILLGPLININSQGGLRSHMWARISHMCVEKQLTQRKREENQLTQLKKLIRQKWKTRHIDHFNGGLRSSKRWTQEEKL